MSVVTNLDLLKQDLSVVHNPSDKTTSFSPTEIIICISWNLNIHNHLHNKKPLVPIVSQGNAFFTLTSYFFKFRFNIIILIKPVSSK
jgi:hypothetical protein